MAETTTASGVKPPEKITLPTGKIPAMRRSPRELLLIAKPKVGKTSALAELENCLILDFQKGTEMIDAMKIEVDSIEKLGQVRKAIQDAGYPYKYVAIDTVTDLEEICIPYAEKIYASTPMGKNWFTKGKEEYGGIKNLPNGSGYPYLRQAFENALKVIRTLAPTIILVGHVKDTQLEKNGNEVSVLDVDLTGKLKRIVTSQVDAIGYMYRLNGRNVISFKTTDEVACGARPAHLSNQEFVISEKSEDGSLIRAYWDKIFID